MSDLKQVRGTVGATAQNSEDRYGVRIGRSWFDGAGQCPVERGDDVEIAYSESGRFRSIEEIRLAEPDEDAGAKDVRVESDAGASVDARIARAVALKCATALSTGTGEDAQAVLQRAARFEQWLRATPQ